MFKSAALLALATAVMARKCQVLDIPISISSRNAVFNLPNPVSEIDVTNFFLDSTHPGTNYTNSLLKGVSFHPSLHKSLGCFQNVINNLPSSTKQSAATTRSVPPTASQTTVPANPSKS
jgi:hypothetical protein